MGKSQGRVSSESSGTPMVPPYIRLSEVDPTSSGNHFRDMNDTIPNPEETIHSHPKPYNPPFSSPILIFSIPIIFILLGIGLEVLTAFSNKLGGFPLPSSSVYGTISAQFIASIVPTLIIVPTAILYRLHEQTVRWYQPYVTLKKGNATAEESLLLNYLYEGPFFSIFPAIQFKHKVVLYSAITACISYAFQPLAGAIFQIRQTPQTDNQSVTSTEYIGLADNIQQLEGFLAGAGYVDAATVNGLGDPPYVFQGWTTAAFTPPAGNGMNDTLAVNTTAIQCQSHCANPAQGPVLVPVPGTTNFTFTSTSLGGCTPSQNVALDHSLADQQYGVVDVQCPSAQEDDIEFRSVMFWFYINGNSPAPEVKTIFCSPTIQSFYVMVTTQLDDGKLDTPSILGNFDQSNNVTGPPNNGKAFNSVLFNPSNDPVVQARANAIALQVPGAIFRSATQQPQGIQGVFNVPNGMLTLTDSIYTQHLSVSGKSIYFRKADSSISGFITANVPRLWIDPLPSHLLAICLGVVGIGGLVLQSIHYRQRKQLRLTAPPGSIASITSLTVRSGFGELLLPYDNVREMDKKLKAYRFHLDERTGAIVAEEKPAGAELSRAEVLHALLGEHSRVSRFGASSHIAFQTAVGYSPWASKYRTPYNRLDG